jgi:DNA-binding MarR family transcriptional regulator
LSKGRSKDDELLRAMAQQMEAQLHGIRRRLRRRLEAEYAKGEVTGPQRLVMEALVQSRGMSLKELTEKVGLAHSTVSGIVDRLEKRGMVTRHTPAQDRRMTQIAVSRAVRDFMQKKAPELTLHPLVDALRRASREDRKAVRTGLDTLARLLGE